MPAKAKIAANETKADQYGLAPLPVEWIGLREENPRDFLAALGLLKVLHACYPGNGVCLCWSTGGHPIFSSQSPPEDNWIPRLVDEIQKLNSSDPHPFVHGKVIKVSHREFRLAVSHAVAFMRGGQSDLSGLPAALYASYGSQIHDQEKGETAPTAFSFSNGQGGKELLRDIRELISDGVNATALQACLTGAADGLRDAKSFRWHPNEFRAAAYRAADPGASVKGDVFLDYPIANILAFFGLSLYPVVDRARSFETCGHSENGFTWPIWEAPLQADGVTSLLHIHPLHEKRPDAPTLRALGCLRAWRARRFSSDKSLYFSPAIRVL